MKDRLSILFAGGGTAGHLLPALATEAELRAQFSTMTTTYLATKTGAEVAILSDAGANFRIVPKTDFPRKFGAAVFTFLPRLLIALVRTLPLVKRADVVVGFGGYLALPAYLAAAIMRKPLIIHEANILPGLANRVGRRFASRALTNFPIAGWRGEDAIGLPIRESIWNIGRLTESERKSKQASARIKLSLQPERRTILVFGGSLGAARINDVVESALEDLLASGFQVLHSRGSGKEREISSRDGYHPVVYISEMDQAYLAADLVISRSGAGTCAELIATGIPAVLVPLPIGNGEQLRNAEQVAKVSNVRVISNDELSVEGLCRAVDELMRAASTLGKSSVVSAASQAESAAAQLARIIVELGDRR